jgi:hypothetical protein
MQSMKLLCEAESWNNVLDVYGVVSADKYALDKGELVATDTTKLDGPDVLRGTLSRQTLNGNGL